MLLTELKAEGGDITIGDRALMIVLSLFSWLMVFYNLIMAWIAKITITGYWDKPIKQQQETLKTEDK